MKIRDLKQYTASICKEEQPRSIAQEVADFAMLKTMFGAKKDAKGIIGTSSSFASNSQEQLFYEFVQNAFDANADTLLFNANKDFLVVLNNGAPFITTKSSLDNDRPGELYSFLSKGDSEKSHDEDSIGKHGQGSKLLYTLIADMGLGSGEEKLISAIHDSKKGPYLISWENHDQLSNIILNKSDWSYCDPDDYKSAALICKIINSYFPICPGDDQTYFSDDECRAMISAFDELVDPKRHYNKMRQGTALLIPLGKGQHELIANRANLSNVMRRLGGFTATTNATLKNKGKHIDHIYVFGEEIGQDEVKSIDVDFTRDGHNFHYQFAFNPVFAGEGYVNFFNYLPIVESRHHLGFIVNSPDFSIDNSRQRISDKYKTGQELKLAFEELLKKINAIKSSDKDLFDYIYRCLLVCEIPTDEDHDYVEKAFDSTLREFLRANVLTNNGKYVSIENVRKSAENENTLIPFSVNSEYTGCYWIDASVRGEYENCHDIEIETVSQYNILKNADHSLLSKWVLSLNEEGYKQFHDDCLSNSNRQYLKDHPLFKSNKNKVYTANEITSSSLVFYFDKYFSEDLMSLCPDVEYIIQPYIFYKQDDAASKKESLKCMFSKIQNHADWFSKTHYSQEFACAILAKIASLEDAYTWQIRSLAILSNGAGKVLPFNQIFAERPANSALFDSFTCKYLPSSVNKSWLISNQAECWSWLRNNEDSLFGLSDWPENHEVYLRDIQSAYNARRKEDSSEPLTLYVNNEGEVSKEVACLPKRYSHLNEAEFATVADLLDQPIIPYRLTKYYVSSNSPFKYEESFLFELIDSEIQVTETQLKALVKLEGDEMRDFRVSQSGDSFAVNKLQFDEHNYSSDTLAPIIESTLSKNGFYRLPEYVAKNICPQETVKKLSVTSDFILDKVLEKINDISIFELIPLFEHLPNQSELIDRLLGKIKHALQVRGKLSKDSLQWKAIKFALDKGRAERIYKLICFNDEMLPDDIYPRSIIFNGHDYDCYELVPEWGEKNQLIESFLNSIPDRELFYDKCVQRLERGITAEEFKNEIYDNNDYFTVGQLSYLIDYAIVNKLDEQYEIDDDDNLPEILEIVNQRHYQDFDKYLVLAEWDSDAHIYADKKYLVEDEYLPKYILDWIKKYPGADRLFSSDLQRDTIPQITFRMALAGEGVSTLTKYEIQTSDRTSNTIEWILKQHFRFSTDSPGHELMKYFIDACIDTDYRLLPRYVGETSLIGDEPCCMFTYTDKIDNAYFVLGEKYSASIAAMLAADAGFRATIDKLALCDYISEKLFARWDLNEKRIATVSDEADTNGAKEWIEPHYAKWCKMSASKGIKIYITPNKVHRKVSLKTLEKTYSFDQSKDKETGYTTDKHVVITYPNSKGQKIMKALEYVAGKAEFFQAPFLALQALYVEEVDLLQDIAEKEKTTIEEVVKRASKSTSDSAGNGDGSGDNMSPAMKKIAENLSPEELDKFAENINKIREMLEDEDEEKQSFVRQMIGYIGELIYENYLKAKGIQYEFSADESEGAYDFRIPGNSEKETIYVDIKTNLYSFADGTVPFYIHSSQGIFLQKHPDAKYRIVRISLEDLNLKKAYIRIRDLYGKEDVNPRENASVKEECQKIAKNYWKSAKIQEFEGNSHEYLIRIEKH